MATADYLISEKNAIRGKSVQKGKASNKKEEKVGQWPQPFPPSLPKRQKKWPKGEDWGKSREKSKNQQKSTKMEEKNKIAEDSTKPGPSTITTLGTLVITRNNKTKYNQKSRKH